MAGTAHAVAIYQASQAIYDIFDKVTVLHDGRQIYFGQCSDAVEYFTKMGWHRPPRQTAGDFLTAVTNPQERKVRDGMESRVPRTADEFAEYWMKSPQYATLKEETAQHRTQFPPGGTSEMALKEVKRLRQAKHVRPKSPYVVSIPMQIRFCTIRAYQRYSSIFTCYHIGILHADEA